MHLHRGLAEARRLPHTALLQPVRSWLLATRAGGPADTELRTGLAALAAPEAADLLLGLLWVIDNGASRPLTLAHPCANVCTADEQMLLDIVALVAAPSTLH